MAKILLVEDDNNLREIYEARLMAEGYDIVSARDGEEALTVAMKERPDLIISDVMMPKISGFDMLDIIRSTEETKNAKVIMMTALSQAEDKERATKLGADRYLVKSQVTLEDVAKVAREVLAGDSGGATPTAEPAATAPAIAQAPTVPEPTTPAPATPTPPAEPATSAPTPTPDPAVTPAPAAEPATTPAPATPAPEQSTKDVASKAMESIMPQTATEETAVSPDQPVEDEQSAIAAQIESFIETSKSETPKTEQEPTKNDNTDASAAASGKKVIQPISDPNASKGPDLENLLKKEEEKQQMQEIAKNVAAEKSGVAEERSAEAILKKAAANPATPVEDENTSDTPQVAITENGDLQVKSEPVAQEQAPATDSADNTQTAEPTTPPVIPHQNGGNIDGVVSQQPSPTPTAPQPAPQNTATPSPAAPTPEAPKPANDPDSIAL